jgi:6-pyruvoyltetrahydropterin/6-carboxytetrahydropterin synthase
MAAANMKMLMTKRYSMSLVHLIPEDYVGKEASRLHGHDFKFEVTLQGTPNSEGQIYNREHLDQLIQEQIIKPYHRTLINEYFKYGTGEFLAQEFLKKLRRTEIGDAIVSVQLIETRKNRFQGVING